MFLPTIIYFSATTTQHNEMISCFHFFRILSFWIFFVAFHCSHAHDTRCCGGVRREARSRSRMWMCVFSWIVIVRLRSQRQNASYSCSEVPSTNFIASNAEPWPALSLNRAEATMAVCWWFPFPIGCYFCAADRFTRAHTCHYRLQLCVKFHFSHRQFRSRATGIESTQQQTIARR